jgi:hypothetical protein
MRGAIGKLNKVVRSISFCFEHIFFIFYILSSVCIPANSVIWKTRMCVGKHSSGLIVRVSIQTTKITFKRTITSKE